MRKITPLIMGICLLAGTVRAAEPAPLPWFAVEWYGLLPPYPGYRITVEDRAVRVHDLPNRFAQPPVANKEAVHLEGEPIVWEDELKDKQVRELREALDAVPVEDLAWEYHNPQVSDGTDHRFILPGEDGTLHETRIHFARRPRLMDLATALDRIVPEDYRSRYQEIVGSLPENFYKEERIRVVEEPPLPRFSVDWHTGTGPSYRIEIERRSIKVRDLRGEESPPPIGWAGPIVWENELTPEQIRKLQRALNAVSVDDLAWSYSNGAVSGGVDYRFLLPDPDDGTHETRIHYVRRPKLIRLAETIDHFVPEKYRLNYKHTIESLDKVFFREDMIMVVQEPPEPGSKGDGQAD